MPDSHYLTLDYLATAIILMDDQSRVSYLNPAAENLFEVSGKNLSGNPLKHMFSDAGRLDIAMLRALKNNASYIEHDLMLVTHTHNKLHVRCTVTPLQTGRLLLEFHPVDRPLKLAREEQMLDQTQANRLLLRNLAHEIKNPLVSIRTFTQILQQKWDDQEFRNKFSSIIPHEIERINRIAESLLKFVRPMKPELAKLEVNLLLDEVLLIFESECKKYNIRVAKKLAELPEITGDAGQLQQVFVNMIKNAIEAKDSRFMKLVEVAKKNTWNKRGDTLDKIIRNASYGKE